VSASDHFDQHFMSTVAGVNELVLSYLFIKKIWVPDTFILNGKRSYLHKITVPNQVKKAPN